MKPLSPANIASAVHGTWLKAPTSEAPVAGVTIDSRENVAGKLFVAIKGETHDGHAFAASAAKGGAAMLLVERDVDVQSADLPGGVLRVENTRRALIELATWYRSTFTDTKVIAVTGSAGKTTTRELIHATLGAQFKGKASPKSFNNDIGVPLTLLAARPDHKYIVAEVGINAVGEMQPLADIVKPDIAVITNVGESHLEGLHDVDTVAREKLKLTSTLAANGLAVLHADSPALRSHAPSKNDIIWFGESHHADVTLVDRGVNHIGPWLELADGARFHLALQGKHNAINALAAIVIGRHFGMTDTTIESGLLRTSCPPMRMQELMLGDVRIINDAYNANPQSMLAGVEAFLEATDDRSRRVLVLGDMCELGPQGAQLHERVGRQLGQRLATIALAKVICVGSLASRHMASALREAVPGVSVTTIGGMTPDSADEVAMSFQPGDVVFLKGSRAMALEQVVAAAERRASGTRKETAPR